MWTRWNHPDGSKSKWTSLGGNVLRGYPLIGASDSGSWSPAIAVWGTDGNQWVKTRSTTGHWSAWHRA